MVILKKKWYEIELEILENLIKNMPKRVQAIINSNGNLTKY